MLYLHVGASHLTTPRPRCETLGVSLGNIAVSKLALECFKITITLLKLKLLPVTGSQSKPILSRRSIRFWERIRSGRCTSTPCTTGHLHHAFLLVGRKLCSAIFTMQPLLLLALLQNRNQTKVLIGVHHKAQNTIEDEWAKTSWAHDKLEDENDGYIIKITQLKSVHTMRPLLLLMKELEFTMKRKTQLRTNGQRHHIMGTW